MLGEWFKGLYSTETLLSGPIYILRGSKYNKNLQKYTYIVYSLRISKVSLSKENE